MASNTSQTKFSLKLMVHKEENRVIFAEADSNFIDTLFSIMTLPLATIIRLMHKLPDENFKHLKSLNNLYQNLNNLPENCMASKESQWLLLNPKSSSFDHCKKLKLNMYDKEPPTKYFICQTVNCSRRKGALFSNCIFARCSNCGMKMDREIKYEDSSDDSEDDCDDNGVFVSDATTFIVTNDLRVMPNTSGCCIRLICDLGINDVSQLESRTFDIGLNQMLVLLKGAMYIKYPLTDLVFPSTNLIRDLVNVQEFTLVEKSISNKKSKDSKKMTLNITLQKSTSKFLFAEADFDFVEFLFGFLEIPLGTLVGKLMNGSSSFESFKNLFSSISSMSVGEYIKSQDLKDMLLKPELVNRHLSENQIFPLNISTASKIYCHSYLKKAWHAYMTHSIHRQGHENEMFCILTLKDPRVNLSYLKASAKFMLTDDLIITPLLSTSSIAMLGKLKVPLNDVEEHKVSIGIEEGLEILEASFKSLTVFTDSILKRVIESKD